MKSTVAIRTQGQERNQVLIRTSVTLLTTLTLLLVLTCPKANAEIINYSFSSVPNTLWGPGKLCTETHIKTKILDRIGLHAPTNDIYQTPSQLIETKVALMTIYRHIVCFMDQRDLDSSSKTTQSDQNQPNQTNKNTGSNLDTDLDRVSALSLRLRKALMRGFSKELFLWAPSIQIGPTFQTKHGLFFKTSHFDVHTQNFSFRVSFPGSNPSQHLGNWLQISILDFDRRRIATHTLFCAAPELGQLDSCH
jgi:hypothetical protein